MAKFIVGTLQARERGEFDRQGKEIPRDKRTRFCFDLPVDCSTADDAINVGILVIVRVPIGRLANVPREGTCWTVAKFVAPDVISCLSGSTAWSIYGPTEIDLDVEISVDPATASRESTGERQIPERLAEQLRQTTRSRGESETAFEKAKVWLCERMVYLHDNSREARSAAHFIANCLRNSAYPDMGPSSNLLLRYVEDLIRRRDTNHPNYVRIADELKRMLYPMVFPRYWSAPPPAATLLHL